MDYTELEKNLNYKFKNNLLLEKALNHSSFVNEQMEISMEDNQRFEFLGDSILNFVISDILMITYPDLNEGELSKKRATLVNEFTLAIIAKKINLGDYIMLGKGEMNTNGNKKFSILSDCFEAVIAAVYRDRGFNAVFDFIKNHYAKLIEKINTSIFEYDYKSQIQEYAQSELKITPVYKIIGEIGPDHDKEFKVSLKIGNLLAEGVGKSKKEATQNAAKYAVKNILQNE